MWSNRHRLILSSLPTHADSQFSNVTTSDAITEMDADAPPTHTLHVLKVHGETQQARIEPAV